MIDYKSEDETLALYIHEISKIPPLTTDQENELERLLAAGNEDARQKLTEANLLPAFKIAQKYQNQNDNISILNLTQRGNIGLIEAAEKYSKNHFEANISFSHFATLRIRSSILQRIQLVNGNLKPTIKSLLAARKEIEELWPHHQALMPKYAQSLKLYVEQRLARAVAKKTLTAAEMEELKEKLGLFAVGLFYANNFHPSTELKSVAKPLAAFLLRPIEFDVPKFIQNLETAMAGKLPIDAQELETAYKIWELGAEFGFILDDGETVSFRYPMFQDYFAAYYFQQQQLNKDLLYIAADWHWHYLWDILLGLEPDLVTELMSFLQAGEVTSLDVIYILGKLRTAQAVDSLIKILENETGATLKMREYAAMSLGQIGDEKAVNFLIKVLNTETNADVRCWIIEGLGSSGDLRALLVLESIAENDKNKTSWKKSLKKAAANAISSIKSHQPE